MDGALIATLTISGAGSEFLVAKNLLASLFGHLGRNGKESPVVALKFLVEILNQDRKCGRTSRRSLGIGAGKAVVIWAVARTRNRQIAVEDGWCPLPAF
jgi:hypothetical protein